jgi:hypothetical protein
MKYGEVFGKIYKDRIWGDGSGSNPLSGSGSNPRNAAAYVNYVQSFIVKNEIASVVDFGHGDWQMWQEYSFKDINYLGVDVAEGLSVEIQAKFGNDTRRFKQLDISQDPLPPGDLLLSKDVLQHLPSEEIVNFLNQIKSFKFAIVCNDIYLRGNLYFELKEFIQIRKRFDLIRKLKNPFFLNRRKNNRDIHAGEFRGINLTKKPFQQALKNYKVELIADYDGPIRPGIKKRVYLITPR